MSDVHLLISPDAGRGRAAATSATVVDRLQTNGARVIDLSGPTANASLTNARNAVAAGAERLVVLGGDGIVHLGLQAVAGTDCTLGVIPIGTGNDFARGIDWIPDDPLAAVAVALHDPTPIDAIRCGGGWTASVATGGFSGVVNERANRLARPRGPSRYTVATVLELPRLRSHGLEIEVDGDTQLTDATMIAIANTAWFGGGMFICPDADPGDGLLDITVVDSVGRLDLLRFLNQVFKGTHLNHPRVWTRRGALVEVRSAAPLTFWGDGESLGHTPMRFETARGALKLAGP